MLTFYSSEDPAPQPEKTPAIPAIPITPETTKKYFKVTMNQISTHWCCEELSEIIAYTTGFVKARVEPRHSVPVEIRIEPVWLTPSAYQKLKSTQYK